MGSNKNKSSNMESLVDFFNNVEKYGYHELTAQTTRETKFATLGKETKNKIQEKLKTTDKSTKLFKKLSVLNEILTTEKSYVEDLHIIHSAFYLPLQASLASSKPIIKEEDFNLIYASIPDILKVNALLLTELDKAAEKSLNVSSVFKKFAPLLKMYQNYVNNFDQATETNSELLSKSNRYATFIAESENAPRAPSSSVPSSPDENTDKKEDTESAGESDSFSSVGSIKLGTKRVGSLLSLLIKPIQRIPRYALLLTEVIKHCEDEFEKRELQEAFEVVKSIAENINKKMHENESRRQLTLICTKFSVNDVAKILENPARLFIKMGFLKKRTRKGTFNEYIFCLFNDCILYSSETQFGKLTLHRMLRFSDSCIAKNYTEHSNRFTGAGNENELADHGLCMFVISTSLKSFVVEANTVEEKEKWVIAINNAYRKYKSDWTKKISIQESITGKKSTIDINQKEGGAPVWMEDTASNNCLICGTEFGFFNRKHHCRRCGKIVCNDCSSKKAIIEGVYNNKPMRVCSRCYYLIHNSNKANK